MSDDQMRDLEAWLLRTLKDGQAARTEDLVKKAAADGKDASPAAINWAIWHLVSSGKLQVTPDYLVATG